MLNANKTKGHWHGQWPFFLFLRLDLILWLVAIFFPLFGGLLNACWISKWGNGFYWIQLGQCSVFLLFAKLLWNRKPRAAVQMLSLIFAVQFLAVAWLRLTFSTYELDRYDGPLGILPHYFMWQGLEPLKDFAVPYLPLPSLLVGKWLAFTSIAQRNGFLGISLLPLVVGNGLVLLKVVSAQKRLLALALLFSCEAVLIGYSTALGSDLWVHHLVILWTLLLFFEGDGGASFWLWGFLSAAMGAWTRFDRALPFFLLSAVLAFTSRGKTKNQAQSIFAGFLTGYISLLSYLVPKELVRAAFDFTFYYQTFITMPFRRLPLGWIRSPLNWEMSLYLAVTALLLLLFLIVREKLWKVPKVWPLLCLLLVALPYAFGRTDEVHVFPFVVYVALGSFLFASLSRQSRNFAFVGFLLLIPISSSLIRTPSAFGFGGLWLGDQKKGRLEESIKTSTESCSAMFAKSKIPFRYSSLYVGHTSYDQFIVNHLVLYFLNPGAPPATKYWYEDPGIQNDCKFGAEIVADFQKAPKPILMLLNTGTEGPEENALKTMKSCGVLEKYFQNTRHLDLGSCESVGATITARLYF